MFKRHKVLLGVLLKSPKILSNTELMKLVFLLKQETCLFKDRTFYDFLPYKYGPYSFTVYRDLDELVRSGYLNEDNYEINESMLKDVKEIYESIPVQVKKAILNIIYNYAGLSLKPLVDHVYKKYPWFTTRSELLNKTPKDYFRGEKAVYTSGYEGRSVDLFFQKLLKKGIQRLIDVRNNPISRKYGFSKKTIGRLSKKLEIDYVHLPQLGIPPSYRTSLNSFDDYQKLLFNYESKILPNVSNIRHEASRLLEEQTSVLVCYEADVRCCHRGRLAKAIASDTGLGVVHL